MSKFLLSKNPEFCEPPGKLTKPKEGGHGSFWFIVGQKHKWQPGLVIDIWKGGQPSPTKSGRCFQLGRPELCWTVGYPAGVRDLLDGVEELPQVEQLREPKPELNLHLISKL